MRNIRRTRFDCNGFMKQKNSDSIPLRLLNSKALEDSDDEEIPCIGSVPDHLLLFICI